MENSLTLGCGGQRWTILYQFKWITKTSTESVLEFSPFLMMTMSGMFGRFLTIRSNRPSPIFFFFPMPVEKRATIIDELCAWSVYLFKIILLVSFLFEIQMLRKGEKNHRVSIMLYFRHLFYSSFLRWTTPRIVESIGQVEGFTIGEKFYIAIILHSS